LASSQCLEAEEEGGWKFSAKDKKVVVSRLRPRPQLLNLLRHLTRIRLQRPPQFLRAGVRMNVIGARHNTLECALGNLLRRGLGTVESRRHVGVAETGINGHDLVPWALSCRCIASVNASAACLEAQ